jgi:Undecaprenyl-diphosphatase (EC 3.6.1.27)
MAPWYIAVILGLLEGLTEFLPVSSTGHLILAGHLLDFTGPKADTFDIAIQLGAILAVVVLYRDRFWGLLRPHPLRRFSGRRGILLLFLTTLPALVFGFLTHGLIKRYLFGPMTVALALFVGALFILAVELRRRRPRTYALDEIGPGLALGIGLFQCLALVARLLPRRSHDHGGHDPGRGTQDGRRVFLLGRRARHVRGRGLRSAQELAAA